MKTVVYDEKMAKAYRMAQPFREKLRKARHLLTTQEAKTLWGQARAGDIEGAERGLAKLIRRHYCDGCPYFERVDGQQGCGMFAEVLALLDELEAARATLAAIDKYVKELKEAVGP